MSGARLVWSGPAGPAALALLAGPWQRGEGSTRELFRVDLDHPPAPASRDPLPTLSCAATRLRADLPRAEAELRAALRSSAGTAPADRSDRDLLDLWRRATTTADVETRRGAQLWLVTHLGASGPTATRVHPDASPAIVALHEHAVDAALRTRIALLRAVRETSELAVTIAATTGAAGVWLALPIAWRFLRGLLAEPAPTGD